jgi:uncharacterized protein YjbJ (UPF0337 family)
MMSNQQIKMKWKEVKSGVRTLWGNITDEELEATKGNLAQISGIVQQKYGETKEMIQEKMDSLMASFDNETDKENFSTTSFDRKPIEGDDDYVEPFEGHRSIIETNADQEHRI